MEQTLISVPAGTHLWGRLREAPSPWAGAVSCHPLGPPPGAAGMLQVALGGCVEAARGAGGSAGTLALQLAFPRVLAMPNSCPVSCAGSAGQEGNYTSSQ